MREYKKQCRKNNQKKIRDYKKKWYRDNPEKVMEYNRKWRMNNKDYLKERRENKRKKDPKLRLVQSISASIYQSIMGNKNGNHWEDLVGYSLRDLVLHLEKQFKERMSWLNYGKWHIDHIRPISSFTFNSYEDKEFKQCWALENLQPLWALENIKKGNK